MIVFVNGEPAECGCTVEVSDGHGEYSNVIRVSPCSSHRLVVTGITVSGAEVSRVSRDKERFND